MKIFTLAPDCVSTSLVRGDIGGTVQLLPNAMDLDRGDIGACVHLLP
jgi:hypothetical protein